MVSHSFPLLPHKSILSPFIRKSASFVVIFAVSKRNRIITLKPNKNMEAKEKVLATMKEAGTPLNAGKIAELSGLDKKEVEKAMKQLKEEGAIVSPVRCKWAPAE